MRFTLQVTFAACVSVSGAFGCSGCGETSAPEPPAWTLELACAVDSGPRVPWATFLVRVRSADARAPTAPVPVTITGVSPPITFTIPADTSVWVEEREGAGLAEGMAAHASAAVAGLRLEGGCVAQASAAATLTVRAGADCTAACSTAPTWTPVAGALRYRAEVSHPGAFGASLDPVTVLTTTTSMPPTAATPGASVVRVSAWSFDPDRLGTPLPAPLSAHGRTLVTSSPGGSGAAVPRWVLLGPEDFSGDTLVAPVPSDTTGERLAILLVNPGASTSATVSVAGTAAAAAGAAGLIAKQATAAGERPMSPAATTVTPAPLAVGDTGSFCVVDLDAGGVVRRAATVRHVSAAGEFWVADDDQATIDAFLAIRPDLLSTLGTWLDTVIAPRLTGALGPFSDVDGNGRVAVVFKHVGRGYGGWTPVPTSQPDLTPSCTLGGGNRSEFIQFTDPVSLGSTFVALGRASTPATLVDRDLPQQLAHELTHLLEFRVRGLTRDGEVWIVEGLADAGADLTGLPPPWVGAYLRDFRRDSLTAWNVVGSDLSLVAADYGGMQLLLHVLRERAGDAFIARLLGDPSWGLAGLERSSGFPLELAMVHLASTAVFSNEPGSPAPWADLTDPAWAPLHATHGSPSLTALDAGSPASVTLQADGWDALVTGAGGSAPVTLTVTAPGKKPWVVVARFPAPP